MRVNVWLPDELNATIRRELPDVNVSAVLQRSLAALLEFPDTAPSAITNKEQSA